MNFLRFFFDSPSDRPADRRLRLGWMAALYLVGLAAWALFFNWGYISFEYHDWAEVTGPRLAFVRDAVQKGELPLHMNGTGALRGVTDRYLSIPDAILSPQMILIGAMSLGRFILVDVLLLYTAGFLGLAWLSRRYRLSPLVFSVFFLLFNFNGYPVDRLSVGHLNNFGGYFFLPWFAGLVLQLFEKEQGWPRVAKMALVQFLVVCQGGFNQFVWSLIFLGLVGVFNWTKIGLVVKAGLFSGLVNLFRILPPALELGRFDHGFLSGYPTLVDLFNALAVLRGPAEAASFRPAGSPLGWWEYDLYVGLAGLLFLLGFGLVAGLRRRGEPGGLRPLLLPLLAITILSIGQMYAPLANSPIPLVNAVRVSTRMMVLVLVFVLILAAIHFQRWLGERNLDWRERLAVIGVLALGGYEIGLHFALWSMTSAAKAFARTPADLSLQVAANHPDPAYTTMLAVGAGIALLAAGFLVVASSRRHAAGKGLSPDPRALMG